MEFVVAHDQILLGCIMNIKRLEGKLPHETTLECLGQNLLYSSQIDLVFVLQIA